MSTVSVTCAFFRKYYEIPFGAIKCFVCILKLVFLSDSQGSFDLLQNTDLSFLDIFPLVPLVEDEQVGEYSSKLDIPKSVCPNGMHP